MSVPNRPKYLPQPDALSQAHSEQLLEVIRQEIKLASGITFRRFMELALYAPGLGYYNAGAHKFGSAGDFITAPEISSLFAQCLAKQCIQIFSAITGNKDLLELGAGSGKMAADLLVALAAAEQLPEHYFIVEISADLKQRQQHYLVQTLPPELYQRIYWLEQLPTQLTGVIVANEVLDAMPVCKFNINNHGEIQEFFVTEQEQRLVWQLNRPRTPGLLDAVQALNIKTLDHYESEINLVLPAWIASLSDRLKRGAILLFDYGFPRHEYYHLQRDQGTLMCHYKHYAHTDPFIWPGLQDITAHVDFTAIAEAADANELAVKGYTNQSSFLLNCGIMQLVNTVELDAVQQWNFSQQIKKLTLPSEMGELFKAIALTRDIDFPLLGFQAFDKRGAL